MSTLREVLERVFSESASRPAVVENGRVTTYAELENAVATLAIDLYRRGVRPGDAVALLFPNGLGFVVSYLAVVSLGAVAVPLNEHYQRDEIRRFLRACRVSCLLTSSAFANLSRQVLSRYTEGCDLVFVDDRLGDPGTSLAHLRALQINVDPEAPVMCQFSSGSTGTPKRIARSHRHLLFELQSLKRTLGLGKEDRFIGVAPFSHVNGLMRTMMASIYAGATLYPVARFQRHLVVNLVEEYRITVFIAVPFMFTVLARSRFDRSPDLSSLRLCVSASAPMPRKFNELFHQRFSVYVRQLYGSTETGTISINLTPDIERTLESVGKPVDGVEVEVFTNDGRVAPAGVTGEFAVRSPGAIGGYLDLGEVNREVFRDGYFFTGDLGWKDEEGMLYLVGRKTFFINKGGYKINPREVEELLEEHPKVQEVAVLGVPTAYGDEKVKAVIVASGRCTASEIVRHCQGRIADFKVPSVIEFRERLPKSPTGKIRRSMLLQG